MVSYKLSLITAPAIEPVTVSEVKSALRIENNTVDDTLIGYLITAARSGAEAYTRRAFITQTWGMFKDGFSDYSNNYPWWTNHPDIARSSEVCSGSIEIPMAPLQSITHLKTYDDTDASTTMSASNYLVSTYAGDYAQPGAITLRQSSSWPTVSRVKDGVEIKFVAGYGTTATSVPAQIRMAIQVEASFLYENRSSCASVSMNSGIAKNLLTPYRVMKL